MVKKSFQTSPPACLLVDWFVKKKSVACRHSKHKKIGKSSVAVVKRAHEKVLNFSLDEIVNHPSRASMVLGERSKLSLRQKINPCTYCAANKTSMWNHLPSRCGRHDAAFGKLCPPLGCQRYHLNRLYANANISYCFIILDAMNANSIFYFYDCWSVHRVEFHSSIVL